MLPTIYVPSKARPNAAFLCSLVEQNYPGSVVIVVEPQDEDAYRAQNYPYEIVVLKENDAGIAYVRNHILDISKDDEWAWMIDDDVKKMGWYDLSPKPKRHPCTVEETLLSAQKHICQDENIVLGSLEIAFYGYWYARTATDVGVRNQLPSSVVLMNVDKIRRKEIRYIDHTNPREDFDFYLQVLSVGYETYRLRSYFFDAPEPGVLAGGNTDDYKKDSTERICTDLFEFWGLDSLKISRYKQVYGFRINERTIFSEMKTKFGGVNPRSVDRQ